MSPPGTLHQIKRKPPPPLDTSGKYPSPDPSDPFASLCALRNRTTSGLESDIVSRARSAPHLYSTATSQVPANIVSISSIPTSFPVPKARSLSFPFSDNVNGFFHQAFPPISNESSPYAFQPDLLRRELPSAHRQTKVRFPRRTYDLNDSGTESDDNSVLPPVVPNTAFVHRLSANHRFPRTSLLKTASVPNSGNGATGNRSSKVALKQARKSSVVSTAVTWIPSRFGGDLVDSRSTSKFDTSVPADLRGSLSDENHLQHHHNKRCSIPSDSREDLKQDLPRPFKHLSISISPKMLLGKRRVSASRPFSFTTAPTTRTSSTYSYVHISMPTLISSTPQHEAAYTSPRKAPAPPPVSSSTKMQGQECPDKSCELGNYCIHSISSEWGLPSPLQLNYASHLPITGEDGKQITFGSLFESQPTIVIFIRHFWCPLCQDYMSSVNSFLGPKTVRNTCENGHRDIKRLAAIGHHAETPVRFVAISNGAHGMIAKYRQIFGLSFKVYTDPSLALYRALGMCRDGDIKNHHHYRQTHRHSTSVDSSISEKNSDISKPGEYVKHGLMGGIAMVVMRAFKVGMPVWEKGGDVNQLGGEFVFGPG